jgi:hypothetical protein
MNAEVWTFLEALIAVHRDAARNRLLARLLEPADDCRCASIRGRRGARSACALFRWAIQRLFAKHILGMLSNRSAAVRSAILA